MRIVRGLVYIFFFVLSVILIRIFPLTGIDLLERPGCGIPFGFPLIFTAKFHCNPGSLCALCVPSVLLLPLLINIAFWNLLFLVTYLITRRFKKF